MRIGLNTREQNRLIEGLREIKKRWNLSIAVGSGLIACAYAVTLLHVIRDKGLIRSIRQTLAEQGFDYTVYELIAVYSECSILLICASFIWRRRILRQLERSLTWTTLRSTLDQALFRYRRAATVSSLLVILIQAAGLPLLLFTEGSNGVLATAVALWALGLLLIAYTHRDAMELSAEKNKTVAGDRC